MKLRDFLEKKEDLFCIENLSKIRDFLFLHDIKISFEKENNKIILNKIFVKDKVRISTKAVVWNTTQYKKYMYYFASIEVTNTLLKDLSYKKIIKILLLDIYKQVIKNNIMMI